MGGERSDELGLLRTKYTAYGLTVGLLGLGNLAPTQPTASSSLTQGSKGSGAPWQVLDSLLLPKCFFGESSVFGSSFFPS